MLQENLKNVQAKIDAALARRSEEKITGSAVTLVAVTKNHPADVITEALSLGVTTIGENRVQEAKAKREMLGAVGRWHLIGHLQTNKAKQAVAIFDMIESADSLHLMQKLDEEAAKAGKVDYILTHTPPYRLRRFLVGEEGEINRLEAFLDELADEADYRCWYFGQLHLDRAIGPRAVAVYRKVLPLWVPPKKKLFHRSEQK